MSVNDYQIELQIALLKLLKSKVKDAIKKRNKLQKLSKKATNIGAKMSKSKMKRDRKQRVAQTFSGSRQQMIDLSQRSSSRLLSRKSSKNSVKRSKSKSSKRTTKRSSSKHGKYAISISGSDWTDDEEMIETIVSKPEGEPTDWDEEKVLTWLQWISQNECLYENDHKLGDEERKNFKNARKTLLSNYLEKFVNAEIDGKALSKLDNVSLRSKVYMNNAVERKIVVKCLEELFGDRKKMVKASKYGGTEYDFSRDRKHYKKREKNLRKIKKGKKWKH